MLLAASRIRKLLLVTSTASRRLLSVRRRSGGDNLRNATQLPTLWETALPSKKSNKRKGKQKRKAVLEASHTAATAATADCCALPDLGSAGLDGSIVENLVPAAMQAGSGSGGGNQKRKLNIVVEGCCHGELPKIYGSVQKMERVSANVATVLSVLLNYWYLL